jgi:hypothetical protein
MSRCKAEISIEILSNEFIEMVNDCQSEGGCGDRRSHRQHEMDAMAQRAMGGVLALLAPHVLCNGDGRCILGGWSLLRGREREREMWCCNRFPRSTLRILLQRGVSLALAGSEGGTDLLTSGEVTTSLEGVGAGALLV